MRDLEPEEFFNINFISEKFVETANIFNFKLMEPSPLEMLSTLEAKSGGSISNEIYAFRDKGDRQVALRFDLTVGLTRYVVSRRDLKMPVKVASIAGVWRYDEPQAGRYRFFHQWDLEIYGPFSTESDAEIIEFISILFKKMGLNVVIEISSRDLIQEYITSNLGVDDQQTISEMFRAVDKVSKKGALAVIHEYENRIQSSKLRSLIELSKLKGTLDAVQSKVDTKQLAGWTKLEELMSSLKDRKVANAQINLGIIRGLDYYSGLVFEAFDTSPEIGALVGGGRYDKLTEAFGRKDIGATGAAGGVERIAIALQKHGILKPTSRPLAYVAYESQENKKGALELVSDLRNRGIMVDYDILGRALRKQLDDSASKGAKLTIIIDSKKGATEHDIRISMNDGSQMKIRRDDIAGLLPELLYSQN